MLRALKLYMADELIKAVLKDREQECAKFIQKHSDEGGINWGANVLVV